MKKILFQGDSITDTGRDRLSNDLGNGYVRIIKENNNYEITNKGVSGDRIKNLKERWDKDTLSNIYDVLVIYVGINDVWHYHDHNVSFDIVEIEQDYDYLIKSALNKNPVVEVILVNPFVLKCGFFNQKWLPELHKIKKVIQDLSTKYQTKYLDLQSVFDQKLTIFEPIELANDGVHPTNLGHQIIAEEMSKIISWQTKHYCTNLYA